MEKNVISFGCAESKLDQAIGGNQFHDLEFSVNSLNLNYQCRIRCNGPSAIFVLVKENSIVLDELRVGDILNMRYHRRDATLSTEDLDTKIKYITKAEGGPYKGHYRVGLDILQHHMEGKTG